MRHEYLNEINSIHDNMFDKVKKEALERLKIDGKDKCNDINKNKMSEFYKQPLKYALKIYDFSMCITCKQPKFAGLHACNAAGHNDKADEEMQHNHNHNHAYHKFECEDCDVKPHGDTCKKHGKDFLAYKCNFCCSLASYYCIHYKSHFCSVCQKYIFLFFCYFFVCKKKKQLSFSFFFYETLRICVACFCFVFVFLICTMYVLLIFFLK